MSHVIPGIWLSVFPGTGMTKSNNPGVSFRIGLTAPEVEPTVFGLLLFV